MGTSTAIKKLPPQAPASEAQPALKISRNDHGEMPEPLLPQGDRAIAVDPEDARKAIEASNLAFLERHLPDFALRIPKDCERPEAMRETMSHERAHELRDFAKSIPSDGMVSLKTLAQICEWSRLPADVRDSSVQAEALRQTLVKIADALPILAQTPKETLTPRQQIEAWLEQIPKLHLQSNDEFSGFKTFNGYLDKSRGRKLNKDELPEDVRIVDRISDSSRPVTLRRDEEQILFRKLQFLVREVYQSADKAIKGRPTADTLKSFEPKLNEIFELRNALVSNNVGLMYDMATKSKVSNVDRDDLRSEGLLALQRAVDTFNPWLGWKLSTYACTAAFKAFSRAGLKESRHQAKFRTGMQENLDAFNEAVADSELLHGSEEQKAEIREGIKKLIALTELNDIEKNVLNLRFGLDNPGQELTLEKAGLVIGVTKERVRQIQNRALGKLKMTFEELQN